MVKRAIFYDRCNDASRLAAEYTVITGVVPTVYYDNGIFCYRWVAGAGTVTQQLKLMSVQPSGDFEINYMVKNNLSTQVNNICVYVASSSRSATDTGLCFSITDQYYWQRAEVAGAKYCFSTRANFLQNVWYNVRIQLTTRQSRFKVWLFGTAEPDWNTFDSKSMGTGGTERPIKTLRPPGSGLIVIGGVTFAANDIMQVANIRITPIPRTGGP